MKSDFQHWPTNQEACDVVTVDTESELHMVPASPGWVAFDFGEVRPVGARFGLAATQHGPQAGAKGTVLRRRPSMRRTAVVRVILLAASSPFALLHLAHDCVH
jgi:hypothetical protein